MKLDNKDIFRANNLNDFMRNYMRVALISADVCKDCRGTGVDGNLSVDGINYSWDGVTFCDTCKGIGFINWEGNESLIICSNCNGAGEYDINKVCEVCKGQGVVDWVEGIKLGISK